MIPTGKNTLLIENYSINFDQIKLNDFKEYYIGFILRFFPYSKSRRCFICAVVFEYKDSNNISYCCTRGKNENIISIVQYLNKCFKNNIYEINSYDGFKTLELYRIKEESSKDSYYNYYKNTINIDVYNKYKMELDILNGKNIVFFILDDSRTILETFNPDKLSIPCSYKQFTVSSLKQLFIKLNDFPFILNDYNENNIYGQKNLITNNSDLRLELGNICNELKVFATDKDIPVITNSHLMDTCANVNSSAFYGNWTKSSATDSIQSIPNYSTYTATEASKALQQNLIEEYRKKNKRMFDNVENIKLEDEVHYNIGLILRISPYYEFIIEPIIYEGDSRKYNYEYEKYINKYTYNLKLLQEYYCLKYLFLYNKYRLYIDDCYDKGIIRLDFTKNNDSIANIIYNVKLFKDDKGVKLTKGNQHYYHNIVFFEVVYPFVLTGFYNSTEKFSIVTFGMEHDISRIGTFITDNNFNIPITIPKEFLKNGYYYLSYYAPNIKGNVRLLSFLNNFAYELARLTSERYIKNKYCIPDSKLINNSITPKELEGLSVMFSTNVYNEITKAVNNFNKEKENINMNENKKEVAVHLMFDIKKVIYSANKVIVEWKDNTKTVVTMQEDEKKYDVEKALFAAFTKKALTTFGKNAKSRNIDNMIDTWTASFDSKVIKKEIEKIKKRREKKLGKDIEEKKVEDKEKKVTKKTKKVLSAAKIEKFYVSDTNE